MHDSPCVKLSHPLNHLQAKHQSSLQRKSASAKLSEITHGRTKQGKTYESLSRCFIVSKELTNTIHSTFVKMTNYPRFFLKSLDHGYLTLSFSNTNHIFLAMNWQILVLVDVFPDYINVSKVAGSEMVVYTVLLTNEISWLVHL